MMMIGSVGDDFEKSLAKLKRQVETGAAPAAM